MNLLFLHPSPGVGRQLPYYGACKILNNDRRHKVIFAYTGPIIEGLDGSVTIYHFDSWVKQYRDSIERKNIAELEREYPNSNLWLGIVSERMVANYSLLKGSFRTIAYNYDELNFLIKAIVIYYQWIFDRENIDAVAAHHPDNIHSTLIFEMCESRPQVPFLLFPDYYWQQERYCLFDSKYFTSTLMVERYKAHLADYERKVLPRTAEILNYLQARNEKDPGKERTDILPKLTMLKNLRNSVKALFRHWSWITLRRPPIIEANYKLWLFSIFRAFFIRNFHLLQHKFSGGLYSTELPIEPFVFFPLQRVPEAAMLARATGYLNQQGFAQSISASLPAGYKLVIKDHPKSRGMHPLSFYRELAELPNVVIMQDEYSNDEILHKTELVVTIGGTLGLQQLMRGKPVVMFGRKFYEILSGVIRIDDLNELPYLLKEILSGRETVCAKEREKSLHTYVATMLDYCHLVDGDGGSINFRPAALASLVDRMLDKEVTLLVSRKKTDYKGSDNVQRVCAGK